MQPETIHNLFGLLSEKQISDICQKSADFQCSFTLMPSISFPEKSQEAIVQLRNDYLVHVQSESLTILSGCQLDYEINFEVLRAQSQNPKIKGQALAIRFIFTNEEKRTLQLFCKQPQKIQDFGRILSKKFIVQLGFHTMFKNAKIIGKGSSAAVYSADDLFNHRKVAVKAFNRLSYFKNDPEKKNFEAFKQEFKTLTYLNHPNLCQLYGVFESSNSTYTVMEYLDITLLNWIEKVSLPRAKAIKSIMKQLLDGISCLHSNGIMHRDLKLENIMVRKKSVSNPEIVIVDFGLAQKIQQPVFIYRKCGTPGYIAPQVLSLDLESNKNYDEKCDIFSLGVIFYALIFRKLPFTGKDYRQIIKNNKNCQIQQHKCLQTLTQEAQDLLLKMLKKNPSQRVSASQALSHEFLSNIQSPFSQLQCNQQTMIIVQQIKNI